MSWSRRSTTYVCLGLYTRQNYPMDFKKKIRGAQLRPFRGQLSTNEVSMSKGIRPKTVLVKKAGYFGSIQCASSLHLTAAYMTS